MDIFKRDRWSNMCTENMVLIWNKLPQYVVEVGKVSTFKRHRIGKVWMDSDLTQTSELINWSACISWAQGPISVLSSSMTLFKTQTFVYKKKTNPLFRNAYITTFIAVFYPPADVCVSVTVVLFIPCASNKYHASHKRRTINEWT